MAAEPHNPNRIDVDAIAPFNLDVYRPRMSELNVGWMAFELFKRVLRVPEIRAGFLSDVFPFAKMSYHNPAQCEWWPQTRIEIDQAQLVSVDFVCNMYKPTGKEHENRGARFTQQVIDEISSKIRFVFHFDGDNTLRPVCARLKKGYYERTVFQEPPRPPSGYRLRTESHYIVLRTDNNDGILAELLNTMWVSFESFRTSIEPMSEGAGVFKKIPLSSYDVMDLIEQYFVRRILFAANPAQEQRDTQAREKIFKLAATAVDACVRKKFVAQAMEPTGSYKVPRELREQRRTLGIFAMRNMFYGDRQRNRNHHYVRYYTKMITGHAYTASRPSEAAPQNLWNTLLMSGVDKLNAALYVILSLIKDDVSNWFDFAFKEDTDKAIKLIPCLIADRIQRLAIAGCTALLGDKTSEKITRATENALQNKHTAGVLRHHLLMPFMDTSVLTLYMLRSANPLALTMKTDFPITINLFYVDFLLFICDVFAIYCHAHNRPYDVFEKISLLTYYSLTDVSYAYRSDAALVTSAPYTHGLGPMSLKCVSGDHYVPFSYLLKARFRKTFETSEGPKTPKAPKSAKLSLVYKPTHKDALRGQDYPRYSEVITQSYENALNEIRTFSADTSYAETSVDADGHAITPYFWTFSKVFPNVPGVIPPPAIPDARMGDRDEREERREHEEEEEEEEEEETR